VEEDKAGSGVAILLIIQNIKERGVGITKNQLLRGLTSNDSTTALAPIVGKQ